MFDVLGGNRDPMSKISVQCLLKTLRESYSTALQLSSAHGIIAGASSQIQQGCVCPQSVMTHLLDTCGQHLHAQCGPQ